MLKSLTNKAFVIIAVLVILGVGIAMLSCSDEDNGISSNKAVNTYYAIYDADDNFVMAWGNSADKDSVQRSIIRVNGTYPFGHNDSILTEIALFKPLPDGYTHRWITQGQYDVLPFNEIGDLPDDVTGLWENKTTGIILSVSPHVSIILGSRELYLHGVSKSDLQRTLASGFERW